MAPTVTQSPPPRLPLYGRCSAAPTQAGPGGPPAGTASASPSGTHPTALFSAVRTAARRHLAASLRITPHLNDTLGATLGQLVDAVSARGGSESAGCQWAVFDPSNLKLDASNACLEVDQVIGRARQILSALGVTCFLFNASDMDLALFDSGTHGRVFVSAVELEALHILLLYQPQVVNNARHACPHPQSPLACRRPSSRTRTLLDIQGGGLGGFCVGVVGRVLCGGGWEGFVWGCLTWSQVPGPLPPPLTCR